MRMNQEKVLIFHMSGDRRKRIEQICFQLGAVPVTVSPEEENAPLGLLAGAEGWRNPLLAKTERDPAPLTEEMLLFAGLSDETLDAFLAKLRHFQVQVSLKAVLTEHNAVWNAGELQGELKRERAEFMNASLRKR